MTKISKKIAKVPNLRFPEFSEEWKEITLGDCSLSLDYGMNAAATNFDGINRYIRITDIDDISSKYKSDSPVSPTGELEDKYLVKENDILFARTGASTGKSYLYKPDDGKLYFAGFLIRVKIDSNYYNANFIFNQTKTVSYNKWVKLMSMRSGQPGINSQEYASFKFGVPLKSEQNKIASFLSLIDERIQTQSKVITQLESLMQGIREKIFKQQLRFKDVNGNDFPDWGMKKLRDIGTRIISKNKENNQKVLTISAQMGLISQLDFFNKSVAAKDVTNYYLLTKNDFAYNRSYSDGYPMGAIKKLTRYDKGVVSTLYICFRLNSDTDTDFIEQYFETGIQNSEIEKFAQEGSRNHGLLNISISDFFNIKISIPCLEEQTKIANFLSTIDERINTEKQLLKQYENQKKYLLQNIFI